MSGLAKSTVRSQQVAGSSRATYLREPSKQQAVPLQGHYQLQYHRWKMAELTRVSMEVNRTAQIVPEMPHSQMRQLQRVPHGALKPQMAQLGKLLQIEGHPLSCSKSCAHGRPLMSSACICCILMHPTAWQTCCALTPPAWQMTWPSDSCSTR